jgi:hypothetical protein
VIRTKAVAHSGSTGGRRDRGENGRCTARAEDAFFPRPSWFKNDQGMQSWPTENTEETRSSVYSVCSVGYDPSVHWLFRRAGSLPSLRRDLARDEFKQGASKNQHCIAVAEEPVLAGNGLGINLVQPRNAIGGSRREECCDETEQRGARLMKVGDQCVNAAKCSRWVNENRRFSDVTRLF